MGTGLQNRIEGLIEQEVSESGHLLEWARQYSNTGIGYIFKIGEPYTPVLGFYFSYQDTYYDIDFQKPPVQQYFGPSPRSLHYTGAKNHEGWKLQGMLAWLRGHLGEGENEVDEEEAFHLLESENLDLKRLLLRMHDHLVHVEGFRSVRTEKSPRPIIDFIRFLDETTAAVSWLRAEGIEWS